MEKRGLATVTVVTDAFEAYAKQLTKLHKMSELPLVTLPHPIAGRKREEVDEMSARASAHLASALTQASA